MEQTIQRPKYENITDLLNNKSEKDVKVQPIYGNNMAQDVVVTATDKIGQGYIFRIHEGKVTEAYFLGAGKQRETIPKKVAQEYIKPEELDLDGIALDYKPVA